MNASTAVANDKTLKDKHPGPRMKWSSSYQPPLLQTFLIVVRGATSGACSSDDPELCAMRTFFLCNVLMRFSLGKSLLLMMMRYIR